MTLPAVEVAVGAIIQREDTLLLIQRGRGVSVGRWSVPGGRVTYGETLTDALVREVFEETALRVVPGAFAGWVERIGDEPFPHHYVILDFFATDAGGEPRAGDDAADARFVPVASLTDLELVDGLADFLVSAGIGPSGH